MICSWFCRDALRDPLLVIEESILASQRNEGIVDAIDPDSIGAAPQSRELDARSLGAKAVRRTACTLDAAKQPRSLFAEHPSAKRVTWSDPEEDISDEEGSRENDPVDRSPQAFRAIRLGATSEIAGTKPSLQNFELFSNLSSQLRVAPSGLFRFRMELR